METFFNATLRNKKCLDVKCKILILIKFSRYLCETAKFTVQSHLRLYLAWNHRDHYK